MIKAKVYKGSQKYCGNCYHLLLGSCLMGHKKAVKNCPDWHKERCYGQSN